MARRRRSAAVLVAVLFLAGWSAWAAPRPWAHKVPPAARSQRNPLPRNSQTVAAGQLVFENTCQPCHGPKGLGDGPAAEFIEPKPKPLVLRTGKLSLPDGVMFWVITHGIDETGMASFGESLSPTERWQTISYLHSLTRPPATPRPPPSTPPMVAGTANTLSTTTDGAAASSEDPEPVEPTVPSSPPEPADVSQDT